MRLASWGCRISACTNSLKQRAREGLRPTPTEVFGIGVPRIQWTGSIRSGGRCRCPRSQAQGESARPTNSSRPIGTTNGPPFVRRRFCACNWPQLPPVREVAATASPRTPHRSLHPRALRSRRAPSSPSATSRIIRRLSRRRHARRSQREISTARESAYNRLAIPLVLPCLGHSSEADGGWSGAKWGSRSQLIKTTERYLHPFFWATIP